jgi:curved DNA-binding protein CbpA
MEFTLNELRQLIHEAANAAYDILGVSKNSSPEEIKRAYRQKAVALHPDKNPGVDTTSKMAKVNVAYSILSDPTKRSKYNSMGDMTVDAEIPAASTTGNWSTNYWSGTRTKPPHDDVWGSSKQKASPPPWEKKKEKKSPPADDGSWKGSRKTRETVDDPYQVQYFTYVKGTSNKFWSVQLTPTATSGTFDVMVRWGRIGSVGRNKLFYFSNLAMARRFIRAKIGEKSSEGYVRSTAANKKEAPKEQPKQEVPPAQQAEKTRKQRTSYKVYGPHHGKPASAHYAGHIYTPQGGQTKFRPGMRANMGLGSDGRLGVNNPETGDTEAWNIDENIMYEMLVEYALRCIEQVL